MPGWQSRRTPEERLADMKASETRKLETAKRLTALRERLGVSRLEFCDRYNIGHSRLSQWERGIVLPELGLLIRICEDHDTSLDYMLRGVKPRIRIPACGCKNQKQDSDAEPAP